LGGGDVADPAALFAGGEAETDEQMTLAGAGVAKQHDRFAGVHVVPGGQMTKVGGLDRRDGVDIEVSEPFQARELGVVDAPRATSFGAVVDLSGEHLGQVGEMGLAFSSCDLGQAGCFGADGRQVQFAGRGPDRCLRRSVDRRGLRGGCSGHVPLPVNRSS
jgi:hypothetical protein